jgi:hypothetical protein
MPLLARFPVAIIFIKLRLKYCSTPTKDNSPSQHQTETRKETRGPGERGKEERRRRVYPMLMPRNKSHPVKI